MKNAIGYIRVSTEGQAGPDKYGAAAQRQAITEYAKANGYTIVDWKEDHISGVKDDRPAFNEILFGGVTNPPVQAVIAFKNDRIARDIKLYFYYQFVLEKKGISLLSTVEDYGEFGDFAPIMLSIMQYVASQERKNISMRTQMGRDQKKGRGGYSGGRVPFGYSVSDHQLIINPKESPAVIRLFQLADAGLPLTRIAQTLNSEGYATRFGGQFDATKVRVIRENRRLYEGCIKYKGEWIEGLHNPILTPDDLTADTSDSPDTSDEDDLI